jgi:hypothetical protein
MRFKSRPKKTILKGIKCDQVGGIESHSQVTRVILRNFFKKKRNLQDERNHTVWHTRRRPSETIKHLRSRSYRPWFAYRYIFSPHDKDFDDLLCVCLFSMTSYWKKKTINRMMLLWYSPGSNPKFRFPLFRRVMETKRIYLKWHKEMKNQNQIEFGVIKTKE